MAGTERHARHRCETNCGRLRVTGKCHVMCSRPRGGNRTREETEASPGDAPCYFRQLSKIAARTRIHRRPRVEPINSCLQILTWDDIGGLSNPEGWLSASLVTTGQKSAYTAAWRLFSASNQPESVVRRRFKLHNEIACSSTYRQARFFMLVCRTREIGRASCRERVCLYV